jgi:hypothetical protein
MLEGIVKISEIKSKVCHMQSLVMKRNHIWNMKKRLRAVVGIARFLVSQGLAFRGHDESDTSLNKGNFLEMVDWFAQRCKDVANVMNDNAPGNHKLTSPKIQKQIVQACAEETMQVIMNELGSGNFALLVDESRDASVKEQMGVIVRLVIWHCFFCKFTYSPSYDYYNFLYSWL